MRCLFIIESPSIKSLYLTQLQPLGVLYIASYLESKGISTDVVDFNVQPGARPDYCKYEIIGYSATGSNITSTLNSISYIKKKNSSAKIVLGGPMASLMPEKLILNKDIDALISGEAEVAFYNFIKKKKDAKGIWLKNKGKPFFTGRADYKESLDSLPFPALEKVPFKRYNVPICKKAPVAGIITSRGCPYGCIFCHHSLGHKFRARSPENVVGEIKRNAGLGIKETWIADDNFTMDIKRAERIFDILLEKDIKMSFSLANGVRADLLNMPLLEKMKKAGVWFITLAPETGSECSLKKINKGFTLANVAKAAKMCKKLGIRLMANFILGFPWEKEKDLLQTIEYAKSLDADIYHFSRLVPYPGTPVWEMAKKKEYLLKEESHNFGGLRYMHPYLSDQRFEEIIKKAYRETMISPARLVRLVSMVGLGSSLRIARYSIETKNI